MNQPILRTEGVTKNFGGFKAVSEVSIALQKSELCALIGPNGAGKTTLLGLITGKLHSDKGHVYLGDRDITYLPSERIVRLGIGRAFQITSLFPKLSVFENIIVPVIIRHKKGLRFLTPAKSQKDIEREVWELLESVGLEKCADWVAGTLSHGDKKRLDLGITLASNPKIMLLDEPTAGVPPEETMEIIGLVKKLHEQREITVLFTEHNMNVVFAIAKRIIVLNQGMVIADGTPQEVKENRAVQEAYFGEEI
jgi:branched-chain amino acid transport system ATP-binding protein